MGDSSPKGTFNMVWRQIWLSQLRQEWGRFSQWEGPGMLLHILECTEQPALPQQRIIQPEMAGVLRLRNPGQYNKHNKF